MSDLKPSFFSRIFLAWVAYFRTLFDADFAAGVVQLRAGALPAPGPSSAPPASAPKPVEPPPRVKEASPDAALQLLSLLQREGRLIDFLREDVSSFSDADIGAAARVVHDGCKKALEEHFTVTSVRTEDEGTRVTVSREESAGATKLVGNVAGEPPFHGTLRHRGWRVTETRLPKLAEGHDARVLAPAEVEL